MKNLFCTLAVLMTLSANAESFNFVCEPPNFVEINRFFAQGALDVDGELKEDEYTSANSLLSFQLITNGNNSQSFDYVGASAQGSAKYVTAMTKSPFVFSSLRLDSDDKSFDIKFLFDFSETFDSKIRDIQSGVTYRANCKITK